MGRGNEGPQRTHARALARAGMDQGGGGGARAVGAGAGGHAVRVQTCVQAGRCWLACQRTRGLPLCGRPPPPVTASCSCTARGQQRQRRRACGACVCPHHMQRGMCSARAASLERGSAPHARQEDCLRLTPTTTTRPTCNMSPKSKRPGCHCCRCSPPRTWATLCTLLRSSRRWAQTSRRTPCRPNRTICAPSCTHRGRQVWEEAGRYLGGA
eukprot:365573-Chlamydomonas_euryale.AAC.2